MPKTSTVDNKLVCSLQCHCNEGISVVNERLAM